MTLQSEGKGWSFELNIALISLCLEIHGCCYFEGKDTAVFSFTLPYPHATIPDYRQQFMGQAEVKASINY